MSRLVNFCRAWTTEWKFLHRIRRRPLYPADYVYRSWQTKTDFGRRPKPSPFSTSTFSGLRSCLAPGRGMLIRESFGNLTNDLWSSRHTDRRKLSICRLPTLSREHHPMYSIQWRLIGIVVLPSLSTRRYVHCRIPLLIILYRELINVIFRYRGNVNVAIYVSSVLTRVQYNEPASLGLISTAHPLSYPLW